jgi:hypothetical protein
MTPNDKQMQKFRVREELKLKILTLIYNFKSEEEPEYKKLTRDDVINVFSSLIARKTQ